jgi:capsular polysaccharide transport system permease protein
MPRGVIDPERQSSIPLQQIAKLQEELIATKAQRLQLERVARENPQLPLLQQRIQLLEQEIEAASMRVAGGDRSLAGKAAGVPAAGTGEGVLPTRCSPVP